jgi:CubicO group peptidase (beta-lactamase class C family)
MQAAAGTPFLQLVEDLIARPLALPSLVAADPFAERRRVTARR